MKNGAVIGVGSMGYNHARILALNPEVELKGLVDENEELGKKLANHFKTKYYSTITGLIEDNKLDFANVAVPTIYHKRISEQLIRAKIHTLVEKPIAASVEEGNYLHKLAKENNIVLLPGHIERYNPAVQDLKKKLNNKELGQIYRIEVTRAGPFPSRVQDIGVARDLAVHDLDVINYLLERKAMKIGCQKQKLIHSSEEDSLVAIITYDEKIVCTLNVNWTSPTKTRSLKIFGQKGMFSLDYINQELRFYENKDQTDNENPWEGQTISEGREIKFPVNKSEPLLNEINYFLMSIDKKKQLDKEIQSSIDVLNLVDKMEESFITQSFLELK